MYQRIEKKKTRIAICGYIKNNECPCKGQLKYTPAGNCSCIVNTKCERRNTKKNNE